MAAQSRGSRKNGFAGTRAAAGVAGPGGAAGAPAPGRPPGAAGASLSPSLPVRGKEETAAPGGGSSGPRRPHEARQRAAPAASTRKKMFAKRNVTAQAPNRDYSLSPEKRIRQPYVARPAALFCSGSLKPGPPAAAFTFGCLGLQKPVTWLIC